MRITGLLLLTWPDTPAISLKSTAMSCFHFHAALVLLPRRDVTASAAQRCLRPSICPGADFLSPHSDLQEPPTAIFLLSSPGSLALGQCPNILPCCHLRHAGEGAPGAQSPRLFSRLPFWPREDGSADRDIVRSTMNRVQAFEFAIRNGESGAAKSTSKGACGLSIQRATLSTASKGRLLYCKW
jgi:hypothetical protein